GGLRGRGVRAAGPAAPAGQPGLVARQGVRRLPPSATHPIRPRPPVRASRPTPPTSTCPRQEDERAGRTPGASGVAVRVLRFLTDADGEDVGKWPIILITIEQGQLGAQPRRPGCAP